MEPVIDHKFIGKEYPVTEYEIGREKMKEYASAVNDSSPYYHDKEFERRAFTATTSPPIVRLGLQPDGLREHVL